MTTEEFLKQDGITPSSFDNQMRNWSYTESQLLGFAERYHQAKLKLLGIGGVVGRSEQLCQTCNGSKKLYDKVFGVKVDCPDC